MRYIIIDGGLSGTGIREKYNTGYVNLEELGLSQALIDRINAWVGNYAMEHYQGFTNSSNIISLDEEGRSIARSVKLELKESKIEYCSAANLTCEIIN